MATELKPGKYGLRVALAFGDTVLAERMFPGRGKVTIGQSSRCTFVLPERVDARRRGRQVLIGRKGLHLLEGLSGRLHLAGESRSLQELRAAGQTRVQLQPEDWGVLHLDEQPRVRLVIQRIRGEILPKFPRDRSERPWLMSTAITGVAFALLLVVSFLRYDPDRAQLGPPEISERMAKVMFSPAPKPPPEEEPVLSDEDEEPEKQRKRAGGPRGRFGDPNRTGPSNIPRASDTTRVGLVRELDQMADSDTMSDLLAASGQVEQAISGLDDGQLTIGAGRGGMATKGDGSGGGGEGEGSIHGTGEVDVGGKGAKNRRRRAKANKRPKEKKVSVRRGRARVKGQLSKKLIDQVVRRHMAQIKFCYNKQLTRHPNLSGKVQLRWVITMSGSVTGAKVKHSSLGNRDAESCMVRALENWKFPKPQGGVVEVTYPFFLSPTG